MKGLLLTMTEPPPEMEEEFNAWYDSEHLPERLAIPGFSSARRFLAPEGKPRYIALYEFADANVAGSAPWHAALATPWAKRIDTLTQDCEWILRTYAAYETEPLAPSATTPHPSPLPARGERG